MILDTSALVAILFGKPEAEVFLRLIWGAEALLHAAGVVEEPVTLQQGTLARQAYDFGKGRHKAALNFGDCFAYALAKALGEPLLFKGNDFSRTDVQVAAGGGK